MRERLVERIRSGEWKPGQLIPNEFEIAAEFGVSQGTARKAIGALAAEGLVLRRQGRGTFVVEHTPAHVLFRFFNIVDDDRHRRDPGQPRGQRRAWPQPTPRSAACSGSDAAARVIRIKRTRTRDGAPFIVETIALPEALFPGLADRPEVANTLYDLFQKEYGVLVMRTDDRLSAAAADADVAAQLGDRARHAAPARRPHRLRARRYGRSNGASACAISTAPIISRAPVERMPSRNFAQRNIRDRKLVQNNSDGYASHPCRQRWRVIASAGTPSSRTIASRKCPAEVKAFGTKTSTISSG